MAAAGAQDTADGERKEWDVGTVVALLAGAVLAFGAWWEAARVLIGEFRPELFGARFDGELLHPERSTVEACLILVLAGAAVAALLAWRPRQKPTSRRIVAMLIVGGLVVLLIRAAVQVPGTRCAFDLWLRTTGPCAPRSEALGTEFLTTLVPGIVILACLLRGARRPRSTISS